MALLKVSVLYDDEVPLGAIYAGLRNAGMDIRRTHESICILTGTIEDTQMSAAAEVDGVEEIEVQREVQAYEL